MAITSTFFATRTLARNAKVDLGGKVIDNGSTAEAGKRWELRWELQVEVSHKTDAIKALAEVFATEVVDVPLAEVEPPEINGFPVIEGKRENVPANLADEFKRAVLTVQATPRKPVQVKMFDRKNNPVMVTHKRRRLVA